MIIAIVGAGGKTSIGSHIGESLAQLGRHTLLTTTTKIYKPDGESVYIGKAAHIHADSCYMVAANRLLPSGKLEGYAAQDIKTIAELCMFDVILAEADGAAGKPVKAPSESEPVYPLAVDLIIGVIGADCLGQPVTEENVHRSALFCKVTGAHEGEPITARHIISLISHTDGLFRHADPAVPKVVFLNKCDTMDERAKLQAKDIDKLSPYPMMLTGYNQNWFGEFCRRFIDIG